MVSLKKPSAKLTSKEANLETQFVEYNLDALFSLAFWKNSNKKPDLSKMLFWGLFWRSAVFVMMPILILTIAVLSLMDIDFNNHKQVALLYVIGVPLGLFIEVLLSGYALKHYSQSRTIDVLYINSKEAKDVSVTDFAKIFWSFAWRFWVFIIIIFMFVNLIILGFDLLTHQSNLKALLESESWIKAWVQFRSWLMLILLYYYLIIFSKMKIKNFYLELKEKH